jgi:site-specific DNA recombinase
LKAVCDAKAVDEQVLHSAFVRLFNRMYENKERFMKTLKANIVSVLSSELNELRQQMLILKEEEDQKEKIKERVDEIIQLLCSRQDILEQFDDNLFNALVEKITILSPAHFVFTLKSGMSIDEIIED